MGSGRGTAVKIQQSKQKRKVESWEYLRDLRVIKCLSRVRQDVTPRPASSPPPTTLASSFYQHTVHCSSINGLVTFTEGRTCVCASSHIFIRRENDFFFPPTHPHLQNELIKLKVLIPHTAPKPPEGHIPTKKTGSEEFEWATCRSHPLVVKCLTLKMWFFLVIRRETGLWSDPVRTPRESTWGAQVQ